MGEIRKFPMKKPKTVGESQVVKVFGHEFTAYFESHGPDPDSGFPQGFIELGHIYIDECPDDVADILAPHVRQEIAALINTNIRAEGGRP